MIQKLLAQIPKPRTRLQQLFILCLMVMIVTNCVVLNMELVRIRTFKKVVSKQLIGYQFAGLDQFVRGEEFIGYYTDGNLKDEKHLKLFAQAQYILAPTILDPTSTDYNMVFFVCTNEAAAWRKIKELNLVPLRRNKFGMILAGRP